jgi:hypothetical protein
VLVQLLLASVEFVAQIGGCASPRSAIVASSIRSGRRWKSWRRCQATGWPMKDAVLVQLLLASVEFVAQIGDIRVHVAGDRGGEGALEKLAALPGDWLADDDRLHLSAAADRAARMAEE